MASIMPELAPLIHGADNIHSMLLSLRLTSPRLIKSPPTQPRRASVAMILRMRPAPDLVFEGSEPEGWTGEVIKRDQWGLGLGLDDFFRLPWVNHPETVPELLFIRRAASHTPSGGQSRWSSHIAFPGGRHEQSDESALYTAYRETWEEIGVDLAEREFVQVGRLDEREITTSLGKRLLMILSPFVFMQTTPFTPTPELQSSEVSSLHWIQLSSLTPPFSTDQWSHIPIDISSRLSPRNQLVQWALRGLVGTMEFGCVLLPDEPDHVAEGFDPEKEFEFPAEGSGSWRDEKDGTRMLRLWGLSLGMTLDLLAHLPTETPQPLVINTSSSSRPSSSRTSPDRERPRAYSLGPKTPTTVESSFDDHWGPTKIIADSRELERVVAEPDSAEAKAALAELVKEDGNAVTEGASGAGLTRQGSLGSSVAIRGLRGKRRRGVGPGMTAVFPRFSYPDVNFWIWVFGRRYRQVVRGWEASVRGPDRHAYRRTNWSGAAMATFYTAVRQALVVAIILRGLGTAVGLGGLTWWFLRHWAGTGVGEL